MPCPCDNDGFCVPVVFRSFVPVLDKEIAIAACGATPEAPTVGAVTELAIITRREH